MASSDLTPFVESCVETIEGSARKLERRTRGKPKARRLLKLLAGKKNILVTTHKHPDPDALASAMALGILLRAKLPDAHITVSVQGELTSGINAAFSRLAHLDLERWSDRRVHEADAVILTDVQPDFAYSPLPDDVTPIAVVDHHRSKRKARGVPFFDVRPDIGSTSSLVFSYFMELEEDINPELAATLLYAIESDLAGAAGTPSDMDNLALSSLTLRADRYLLYRMRYVELPRSYYVSFADGVNQAVMYDDTFLVTHLGEIDTLEKPAVIADFLLRLDGARWVLVTALHEGRVVCSLRAKHNKVPAADIMRKLVYRIGEGGGHKTKAGGFVPLTGPAGNTPAAIQKTLIKRLLRLVGLPAKTPGHPLAPQLLHNASAGTGPHPQNPGPAKRPTAKPRMARTR